MKEKVNSPRLSTDNNNYNFKKRRLSINYKRKALNIFKENNLPKNENDSSKKLYLASKFQTIIINQKLVKIIDPDSYIYESKHLLIKPRDFISLCNDLRTLEIQNRNFYQINNGINDIEDGFDFANMNNNLKLNEMNYCYDNVIEIMKIVERVIIPPEERKMGDLLEIVKFLTTTKLGIYFKENFEKKEIFEKLITFCGVEMKYKLFKKGETIFRIGDLPDNFYIILLGKVDILKPEQMKSNLTGYQYFSYLMDLKKSKDEHLFKLCIQANRINFRIDYEDIKNLKYIYIYIMLEQIYRKKYVDFDKGLNLLDMSFKDFDLYPDQKQSNDIKYIAENIKKIKIYLPNIPITIISKYAFFKDTTKTKEVVIYNYSSFLTLDTKSHFGDSAMDTNTTRNATIKAKEDTHTAYISCNSYFRHVLVEKFSIDDKKIHFLNTNFFFNEITPKKFEQKYFGLFVCNTYKKGDIIFQEDYAPNNVYFIEEGNIELYTSKNIYELQNVIEYLEQKRFKFLKNKNNKEEKSNEKEYFFTYNKINFRENDITKEINEKKNNKIFLLKENEDLGILSFYFGYPYFATSIVSSNQAKIYQIDNKHLSEIILKEKRCYPDLIKRVEHKLSLFHERFFNINNTKLLLADHLKSLDNQIELNNLRLLELSNNNINNNNKSQENISDSQKKTFNKIIYKINFNKIKNVVDKIQKSKSFLKKDTKNLFGQKLKNNINSLKTNLPLIYTQKSIKVSDGTISTDKTYSIKLKSIDANKDEDITNSKSKNNGKKCTLIKDGIFSNSSVTKAITVKKIKHINYGIHNFLLRNKSCTYLEEKKCCIDPILKKNCEKYENLNNNKKMEFKFLQKNKSMEESKIKAKSLILKHFSCKKKKAIRQLNDIKLFNNNPNNNSFSCKSKSYSRNNMNLSNNQNIEENNNNNNNNNKKNKGTMVLKETILDYKYKDAPKKANQKLINHPYFSPLVLRKKEFYEIFNEGKPLPKNLEKSNKFQNSIIEQKELEKMGFFLQN